MAKRCYEALMPGASYEENQIGGEFLGGVLFECGQYLPYEPVDKGDNHHVMIAFYPAEENAKCALFRFIIISRCECSLSDHWQ